MTGYVTDELQIRLAQAGDMQAHCDIVNQYIETTTINFRTEPQTAEEWHEDWKRVNDRYPWLVAISGERTLGIAYASPWKPRRAYDWTVETTVYVREGDHRRGLGRALYQRLLEILDAQGYRSEIGVIALPNESSVALHEAVGFAQVGTLVNVGHKLGGWRSTGLWQRRLELPATPAPLQPVSRVVGET